MHHLPERDPARLESLAGAARLALAALDGDDGRSVRENLAACLVLPGVRGEANKIVTRKK